MAPKRPNLRLFIELGASWKRKKAQSFPVLVILSLSFKGLIVIHHHHHLKASSWSQIATINTKASTKEKEGAMVRNRCPIPFMRRGSNSGSATKQVLTQPASYKRVRAPIPLFSPLMDSTNTNHVFTQFASNKKVGKPILTFLLLSL